jgi:ribosomal protein S18 acetylase RimI-like enzyme
VPLPDVRIRPRADDDLTLLADVLAAQHPYSGYPQRWPLPFPVEDFIRRDGEDAAWVALLGAELVGHVSVCRVAPGMESDLWTAGTGRAADDLAAVSVLFVSHTVRGRGVGSALLATAVEAVRASGRTPVLDVVQETTAAVELYRRSGWRVVGEGRPSWLPEDHLPVLFMALPEEGPTRDHPAAAHERPATG